MRAVAFLAILIAAACGPSDPAPVPAVAAAPPAARVVSLSPSATEIVAALGATSLLVGVDSFSKYPPEVAALPKVGDYLHPSVEVIVQMKPTLVIADDVHAQAAAALRDAGVHAIVCPIQALPDVERALAQVGGELGRAAQAAEVSARMDAALAAARAHQPASHPRVLVVIDRDGDDLGNMVAAGPGSYVDDLLAVVGGDNVLRASPAPYPKISTEEILRGRPDVILDLSFAGKSSLAAWTGLDVPALRDHRVVAIGDDVLMAPTPRVALALAKLAAAIAPPAALK